MGYRSSSHGVHHPSDGQTDALSVCGPPAPGYKHYRADCDTYPETSWTTSEHNDSRRATKIPRRHHESPRATPDHTRDEQYLMEHMFTENLASLMGRTYRAYMLVIDYEKDCPDGHRWYPRDIEKIRKFGQDLRSNIGAVKHSQKILRKQGFLATSEIEDSATRIEEVRRLCNRVQDHIRETEQVPARQLQYTGRYFMDERGALYTVEDAKRAGEGR